MAYLVASLLFCVIEGTISTLNQRRFFLRVLRIRGDPDTHCDGKRILFPLEGVTLDCLSPALSRFSRVPVIDSRKQSGRLSAPVARNHVDLARMLDQKHAQIFENKVSGRMAKRIIEALKVINIENQQTQVLMLAAGSLEFTIQRILKISMVEEPRQTVRCGELFHAFDNG